MINAQTVMPQPIKADGQGATRLRCALVWWVAAAILGHLLVGMLLPWVGAFDLLDSYHRTIEQHFWGGVAPAPARAQQLWWMALIGPTVQATSLWMAALAWIGARQRSSFAWASLIAGLLLWAPQDILISLQAHVWSNVWVDLLALATLLPPLAMLYYLDRAGAK